MDLLDVLLWMVWVWAVLACIWLLVWIGIDIFRDRELSGWAKAGWVVFLVLVPFIAALVYLIARGDSMAERERRRQADAMREHADYIRSVAGTSPSAEIDQAAGLLDAGVISREEFDALKAKSLA